MSTTPEPPPPNYPEIAFERDYGQTVNFFARFGDRLTVSGRSLLDVGCGRGPSCVYAALQGAEKVVGVDIREDALAFARSHLARNWPDLVDVVEFRHTRGDLSELGAETFDVIISQNSFEHYRDPEQIARRMKELMHDESLLAAAFGPLWRSPYGGHIDQITKLPWAHLLFPESVIMQERRRLLPHTRETRFDDLVNRMTVQRFRALMADAGLACVYFDTNVSKKAIMRAAKVFSRIPYAGEFLTHNVYSLWRRAPQDATSTRRGAEPEAAIVDAG